MRPKIALSSHRHHLFLALLSTIVFAGCFFLYTRHNDHPLRYNVDEPRKVKMVILGTNEFRHPLLLISVSRFAARIFGVEDDRQSVVMLGRHVSAFFAAVAVLSMTLLGWRIGGMGLAVLAACFSALSHQLLFRAHIMKEDTALLAGFALFFLALDAFFRRANRTRVILLGAAAGVVLSGKYIGVVAPIFAVVVIVCYRWDQRPGSRWKAMGWFAAGFLPVLGVLNYPALLDPAGFLNGLSYEVRHVSSSHHGLAYSLGWSRFTRMFTEAVAWPVVALGLSYSMYVLLTWSRRAPIEKTLVLFVPLYGILISFSKVIGVRYFLPAFFVTHFLGAMAIYELLRYDSASRYRRTIAVGVLLTVTLYVLSVKVHDVIVLFKDDPRQQLEKWVSTHLPPGSIIAQDEYVSLLDIKKMAIVNKSIPYTLVSRSYVVELGELEEMAFDGFTHIAVSDWAYGRFFNPNKKPVADRVAWFDRTKAGYEAIFERCTLLKSIAPAAVGGPTVKIYAIPRKIQRQAIQVATKSRRDLRESWSAVVDYLSDRIQPNDLIVLSPEHADLHFSHHSRRLSIPLRIHYVRTQKSDYIDRLKPEITNQKRVWLVFTGTDKRHGKAKDAILNFMLSHFSISDQYHPAKIGVYLFESDPPHWEAAVRYMVQRIKPEDLVVLSPGSANLFFDGYAERFVSIDPVYCVDNSSENIIDELHLITSDRPRIWFLSVGNHSKQTKIKQHISGFLKANYVLIRRFHPYKIDAFLFESAAIR